MKPTCMCRYALVRNTWPETPAGWEADRGHVLAEVVKPHDGRSPAVIDALWFPGCGYSVHFSTIAAEEPRRLSESAKQSIRRKALERRVRAQAPLFAEAAIASALEAQPAYYGTTRKD